MDDQTLKTMSMDGLKKLVSDTEETLGEIKEEIERRENAAQENEIAHLDVHMKNAELSLETIRNFFRYLKEEMRKS